MFLYVDIHLHVFKSKFLLFNEIKRVTKLERDKNFISWKKQLTVKKISQKRETFEGKPTQAVW